MILEWFTAIPSIGVLLILMLLDIISGFLAGQPVSWRTANTKVMTLVIITVCKLIEGEVGEDWKIARASAIFYCFNELLSILKNAKDLGVPIPPVISSWLDRWREATRIEEQRGTRAAIMSAKAAKSAAQSAQVAAEQVQNVATVQAEQVIEVAAKVAEEVAAKKLADEGK